MKDKKLLKMLKSEVDSMTPNILPDIKNSQAADKKRVTIINEKYSRSRRWLGVLATCMIVIVVALCVSVPIIMSHQNDCNNGVQSQPVIDNNKTADDVEEDLG